MNTARKIVSQRDLIVATAQFGLSSREIELIRANGRALDGHVAATTDAYYDHLIGTGYAHLLPPERVTILKPARINHWRLLLDGDFSALQDDYLEHFGPRLIESGIPQSVFVIAANCFAVEFARFVEKSRDIPRAIKHELRIALLKLAFYDLALAQAAREVTYLD